MTTKSTAARSPQDVSSDRVDAVVVGAGFAGLYAIYKLRERGFSAIGFEGAPDVGGTWYSNRYPGCRCDIESLQYSYQFSDDLQQEWEWSERFAAQPDILAYIRHVADRFDLKSAFQFNTRVTSATFDEGAHQWAMETDTGRTVHARFLILGVGCLSSANIPEFEGMADFKGEIFHTSDWPEHAVDFSGKRVGIIGTGSSAVQIIPLIAQQAVHLKVFQRTPNYVVPARNRQLAGDEVAAIKVKYGEIRELANQTPQAIVGPMHNDSAADLDPDERQRRLERHWQIGGLSFLGAFGDIISNPTTNEMVVEFWREKVRETVIDPKVAERLLPTDDIGCKRICSGTDYFETYNRENVLLVDIRNTGIERFVAEGLVVGGDTHDLDVIICATGFDAMTGSVMRIDIKGVDGQTIQEKWGDGPRTYLGLTVAGFPNMFNMAGPGSPSVLATMVTAAEQHGDFITDCLDWMRDRDHTRVEATLEAEQAWGEEVNKAAAKTLRMGCNSWHLGANIPGKPRQFMPYIGGYPQYLRICEEMIAEGYRGLSFS